MLERSNQLVVYSVTFVSGLRLQSLIYFASTVNPTWDQWTVAWWSTIELNVGFICTCLPTFRLVLVRMWPGVFGWPNDELATEKAQQPQSQKNLVSITQGKMDNVDIEMQRTISKDSIDPSEVGMPYSTSQIMPIKGICEERCGQLIANPL